MCISDGQEIKTFPKAETYHRLPDDITKIDVFFTKSEQKFHSMVFYGDRTVAIGLTPEHDQFFVLHGNQQETKGRKWTFTLPKNERLLGCEMHYDKHKRMKAISWITIHN